MDRLVEHHVGGEAARRARCRPSGRSSRARRARRGPARARPRRRRAAGGAARRRPGEHGAHQDRLRPRSRRPPCSRRSRSTSAPPAPRRAGRLPPRAAATPDDERRPGHRVQVDVEVQRGQREAAERVDEGAARRGHRRQPQVPREQQEASAASGTCSASTSEMPASVGRSSCSSSSGIADGAEGQGNALVVVRVPEAQLAVPQPLEREEAQRQEVAARGRGSRSCDPAARPRRNGSRQTATTAAAAAHARAVAAGAGAHSGSVRRTRAGTPATTRAGGTSCGDHAARRHERTRGRCARRAGWSRPRPRSSRARTPPAPAMGGEVAPAADGPVADVRVGQHQHALRQRHLVLEHDRLRPGRAGTRRPGSTRRPTDERRPGRAR